MKCLKESWVFIVVLVLIFGVCYLLSYIIEQNNRNLFNDGYLIAYSQHRQGILDSKVSIEIKQQFEERDYK